MHLWYYVSGETWRVCQSSTTFEKHVRPQLVSLVNTRSTYFWSSIPNTRSEHPGVSSQAANVRNLVCTSAVSVMQASYATELTAHPIPRLVISCIRFSWFCVEGHVEDLTVWNALDIGFEKEHRIVIKSCFESSASFIVFSQVLFCPCLSREKIRSLQKLLWTLDSVWGAQRSCHSSVAISASLVPEGLQVLLHEQWQPVACVVNTNGPALLSHVNISWAWCSKCS